MIASRFSARRVYFLGIALFTLSSAACGLSDALWKLITTRVVQGAAGGLMMTVGRTLALRDAPKSQLVLITSLLVWPALLAPVLGPPPGGWITTYASWRWDFLLNLPLGLLGLLCVARCVPPDPPGLKVPLDWRGAAANRRWPRHIVRWPRIDRPRVWRIGHVGACRNAHGGRRYDAAAGGQPFIARCAPSTQSGTAASPDSRRLHIRGRHPQFDVPAGQTLSVAAAISAGFWKHSGRSGRQGCCRISSAIC